MHMHMANDIGVNINIAAVWSLKTKANCQRTEVTGPLSGRSGAGKESVTSPKSVCVGGWDFPRDDCARNMSEEKSR